MTPVTSRRPVTGFDVVRVGDGVRLAISATGDFEHLAYQSDDQYVVEVQPARKAAQKTEDKRVYTGERLTLNFQDIETRAVLQLLADASGQNIVVSDSVQGSVTLRLQNVPWDQALDIVLRTKGLDKRRNDNVIIVAPTEELAVAREGRARRPPGRAGTRAAALRVPAGQLREGRRSRRADQVAGRRRRSAVQARHGLGRRTHEHAAAAGFRRPPRRHPSPRRHARHSDPPGADRSAHRDRQR